ncbi:MAG: AMP-dependent synthetase and ligase [Phenylobacterium sp.]|nr:AMP-dependent synthetase and ligase [Phenylobacterium sp.]
MGYLTAQIAATLAGPREAQAIQFKGHWTTWGDIADIAGGLERLFEELGLGPGAAVGCALRNAPEHAAVMVGVVASERCLVTFNALAPDDKLAADVLAARAPVMVAIAADWERPAFRDAVAAAGAAGVSLTGEPDRPVALVAGLEAVGPGPHQPPLPGVAILMLTSGTTGPPKRVPLKLSVLERQLVEAAGGQRHAPGEAAPILAAGVGIMSGSLVHIGGVWGVLGQAMSGRPSCMLERFTVADWRAAVVEHRPKAGGAPPAALRMILDANIPKADLQSLVTLGAGSAALDPAIVDEFLARYDLPVLSNYGATEFAGGVASWSYRAFREYWTTKRGAAGRIHKGIEARVVDPQTDTELPLGAEGVLELRGFAAGDGDSWIRTTDRAVLDAERFLWIRGRADNAINRGGFKVQPDDVIAALEQHPAVREASVVGLPDRRLGEAPVAAIVLRSGAPRPSDDELAAWVRGKLIAYCVPVAFRVVDELPRTPSMKVSIPAVRELFSEEPGA